MTVSCKKLQPNIFEGIGQLLVSEYPTQMQHVPYRNRGGSRIPRRRGRQPTILPKFSIKLHEIAKILGNGGRAPGAPPLDPPLQKVVLYNAL